MVCSMCEFGMSLMYLGFPLCLDAHHVTDHCSCTALKRSICCLTSKGVRGAQKLG